MEGHMKVRPIDAALAFAVAVTVIATPAYFLADFEARGVQASSERHRALSTARLLAAAPAEQVRLCEATRRLPDQRVVGLAFALTEGGLDEYDIEREAMLFACGPDGSRQEVPSALEARLREAAGKVKASQSESGGEGVCTEMGDGRMTCGVVRQGGGVAGVVYQPGAPALPVLWPALVVLLATVVAGLAFGRVRESGWWKVALGLGVVAGLASSLLIGRATDSVVQAATALDSVLGVSAAYEPATGPIFVLVVTALFGVAAWLLLRPVSGFFAEFRHRPFIYAAIAPAMVGMVVLIFVPFFMGVYLAFLDNNRNFVGLDNFIAILFPTETSDTNFYFTLGVTVMWTVLNVSLHVVIGLALALVLSDQKLRGRAIYRVLLIVPWAVPNYITALVWKWIFNTQYGPANAFLALLGMGPVDWLGQSFWTNFAANLATNTWLGFPFMMVISLGALQSIPPDLYEAAEMDGASRWQRFRHVTLPLLKPALFPAIILGTIWTFNMFNVVYLVSGGGPNNKTNILITEAYRAFRVLKNYGLAAAYSLIIFFILAAYTAVTNRITKAAESVYE